ncbi:methyltransferase domain-containing protein [Acidobacteriota bacterium]
MKNFFYLIVIVLVLSLFLVLPGNTIAQKKKSNMQELRGPYLGQKYPGLKPEIFAPGIISTDMHEGSSGFNLNSTHFVFQRIEDGKVVTYEMEQKNGQWTKATIVPFAHMMRNGDFVFAPDGKTLYFQSNTPIEGLETKGTISNIWMTKKTETSWTEPEFLDFEINTRWLDSFASATTEGTLYFFSQKPGGKGKSDLYMSEFVNGKYAEAENLGDVLNTAEHEWDPFIAPDERYLIFCSTKSEGYGSDDFYISFRKNDQSWSTPVNMGKKINTKDSENRPYVTPDGKYFFFTSTRRGNRDIYWVDAKIIDKLKQAGQQQSIEEWEKTTFLKQPPEKVMDASGIKAGMIIGEVGAGRGRFTMHLARRVGTEGKILANDIDSESLAFLKDRCLKAGITNVETILGEVDDPYFPEQALDMVFMVWTYHFFEKPITMLKKLRPTLKPGGKIVLVEPDPIRGPGGAEHGISPERMHREAEEAGFEVVRIDDFLPQDLIFVLKYRDQY